MKQGKTIIIAGILIAILTFTVAYAAFAANLQVTGTAKIDSDFQVKITSIVPSITGDAIDGGSEKTKVVDNGMKATFDATLINPGDKIVYTVTVENLGKITADLTTAPAFTVANLNDVEPTQIKYTVSTDGMATTLNQGDSTTFTVTAEYVGDTTPDPANASKTATVEFTYTQKTA